MLPYLFHIYGPIYANCYGLMIALGLVVFTYLMGKDSRCKNLITPNQLQNIILLGIVVGIAGGRLLWIFSNWKHLTYFDVIAIWDGGLSVLGALLAILFVMPIYLRKIKVAPLELFDLAAIYTPLLQSISRIGCFLAGCCYGTPTCIPLGIIYTHPDIRVPDNLKFIPIHPTQLYSSALLLGIFLIMYFVLRNRLKRPGLLLCSYLMLQAGERFSVDYFRADQEFFNIEYLKMFSIHQWISIVIFSIAAILFLIKNKTKSS